MKRKTRCAYVDRFGNVRSDLVAGGPTLQEVTEQLNPEGDDLLVNPWRRAYGAALRRALGH